MKDRPEQEPRSYRNMLKNVAILSGMWGMGLGAAFVQIPAAQNVLVENGYSSISTVPLGLIFFTIVTMCNLDSKTNNKVWGEEDTVTCITSRHSWFTIANDRCFAFQK
jgi:hypothetical protein